MTGPRVLVAGAGIMGASVSLHLARRGASVTVLDPLSDPPGSATRASWAWLNANKKNPVHYRDLNAAGIRAWHTDFPELLQPCGSLLLDDPAPSTPDAAYPCHPITSAQQLR
ncbi:hypothetical protein V8C86DRAFT_1797451, partial [Haematococcus lacustris]